MNKIILITSKDEISILDFPELEPGKEIVELDKFRNVIDCDCIEIVRPKFIPKYVNILNNIVMVVDGDGFARKKNVNVLGSIFYGYYEHGCPIVGDVILMTERFTMDGPALYGLSDKDADAILFRLKEIING